MKRFLTVSLAIAMASLLLTSCAKNSVVLGSEAPEIEFQKCRKLLNKNKYDDAVQCLEMFKAKFPKSREARLAELIIGDAYFRQKDYLLAAESYEAFLRLYPFHEKAGYAHYRAGISYAKQAPKSIARDQKYLYDALPHLRRASIIPGPYQDVAKEELAKVNNRITRRDYYVGRFYYKQKQYIACRPRFVSVVNRAAKSKMSEKSLYYIIKASIVLDDLEEARKAFTTMDEIFPGTKLTEKARRKLLSSSKKKSK